MWISEQCHGVAKGLYQIHERHLSDWSRDKLRQLEDTQIPGDMEFGLLGDIKPANILWFNNPQDSIGAGILKICDFGLAQFHSRETHMRSEHGEWKGCSPTYRPPEWELETKFKGGRRKLCSRKTDIWGLGCVYLEFVTWILLGSNAIEEFSKARSADDQPTTRGSLAYTEDIFFQVEAGGLQATVKESWIKKLDDHPQCCRYLHEFLGLIKEHMLVTDQNKRAKCDFVKNELQRISTQYHESDDYTVRPRLVDSDSNGPKPSTSTATAPRASENEPDSLVSSALPSEDNRQPCESLIHDSHVRESEILGSQMLESHGNSEGSHELIQSPLNDGQGGKWKTKIFSWLERHSGRSILRIIVSPHLIVNPLDFCLVSKKFCEFLGKDLAVIIACKARLGHNEVCLTPFERTPCLLLNKALEALAIRITIYRDQECMRLAGRAEDNYPGGAHNPALLMYLPFCKKGFDMVLRKFYVHGSIVRTVNRGYPIFSRTRLKLGTPLEPAIGDLALSMTYFPLRKVTYGILYGCDGETKKAILARLHNSEDATCHPLLLIGIFTELERKRQLNLVQDGLDALHDTILNLSISSDESGTVGGDRELSTIHAIDPWLNIHNLKNSLESWKEQLAKFAAHIDELSETWFNLLPSDPDDERAEKCQLREVGKRIKERILEIVYDYDAKIRECVMIMEGMNLATQLALARANIEIAAAAKTDSSQMKTIALVTMVFLPATFVAKFRVFSP
ncbi:hypothetical protein FHL15_011312 [Xylaria flabelliformis]|uniref:Protein kinase domain-containing protein n=1 Tax=Xylaria flabelliformis TaxID=2512241 RepID=A0A553HIL5_9PEZI|nr:hypothetical protein FHL15_011312 [Xylaria flabelliformis]